MCIARNSSILMQSKGNNCTKPNDILMNIHMHHHTMAIHKLHEIPSISCQSMAEDMKNHGHSEN